MKSILLIALIGFSTFSMAETVDEAFRKLYDHESIEDNACGRNVRTFLNYLHKNEVPFKGGFVVTLHEPHMALYHFDARWGYPEKYDDGTKYQGDNWYHHVFAVIDGKAYDFSQAGSKTEKVKMYLKRSYLPAKRTKSLMFDGKLTVSKALKKYEDLEMKIFKLNDY